MTAIYDPACPPIIFDGLVPVFSTCRDCGELMTVCRADRASHPCCTERPTRWESLATGWLSCILADDHESAELTAAELAAETVDIACSAVQYTQWEWPVFPLARQTKIPAIKGGKGFKDATDDSDRIKRWWTRHPEHNIGLATGHLFDVVDVDTKDSDGNPDPKGVLSLMQLLDSGDVPDVHGVAVTASGGMHLYVKPTGKGNFAGLRPGIDYRGKGGYVVAPPSHLGGPGRAYTWLIEPSPIIKGGF